MDPTTGTLTYINVTPSINPAYLSIHPNKQWLYSVNELGSKDGKYIGAISAFRIDLKNKKLQFINSAASCGNSPCYISIDKTGQYAMTANYGNGSVAALPIGKDGSLGEVTSVIQHQGKGPNIVRQAGPHAHMITQGLESNTIYSVDLGIDEISLYSLDAHGKLTLTGHNMITKPGAGPRHLAFHPYKPWAYVVNELNGSIEAFTTEKITGALARFQTISILPGDDNTSAPGSAAIHITPNGKYLYATNRGEFNNIAMFSISQSTGELTLIGHQASLGKTPRDFVIDPTGKFLLVANQTTSDVITFKIDASNGKLIDTGIVTKIPNPGCLKFLN